MSSYYIYNVSVRGAKSRTVTVIFFPGIDFNTSQLQNELRRFYTNQYQADKTVIIFGAYLMATGVAERIFSERKKIFLYVPKLEENTFYENLHLFSFDIKGKLSIIENINFKKYVNAGPFIHTFLRDGLAEIFLERGGLVEATGSHHHYVFPSGKHSDKFLRVANILLYSPEIYFIAFGLLNFFDYNKFDSIYCDTSSINSVALALVDLINRLTQQSVFLPINSFNSYDGIYNSELNLSVNSFVLISASTSGGLVSYLRRQHAHLRKENIVSLFFLENRKPNEETLDQVLCNLTKAKGMLLGLETFKTFDTDDCHLCKAGSYPVMVAGDVFLLEQPKVNSIRITGKDIDAKESSDFINQFMSINKESSVFKINFNEDYAVSEKKYEIYIDYSYIIENIEHERFEKYRTKINSYIDQFVPSNTKYILYLIDPSSKKLAEYILSKIATNYAVGKQPILIGPHQFNSIARDVAGSILVVGSCISSGKYLLYYSRALRNYDLRIVYFIGVNRPYSEDASKFLKSNLRYGKYGSENSSLIEVEKFYCSNLSKENSWQQEIEFLKKQIELNDEDNVRTFLDNRRKKLEEGYSSEKRGLHAGLFLPIITADFTEKQLEIRRNSAFFYKDDYAKHVSQSDVYFSINYVINRLRYGQPPQSLRQTAFVRNVISPENLNRFNDGIIQASILRSTTSAELNYSNSDELSAQMRDILITIFKYCFEEQGEATLEFLYAMAIQKLKLKKQHIIELLSHVNEEHIILKFYKNIIKQSLETKPDTQSNMPTTD